MCVLPILFRAPSPSLSNKDVAVSSASAFARLGLLFNREHRCVFQMKGRLNESRSRGWLALQHFPGSALLVWPCKEEVDDDGVRMFHLELEFDEPQLFSIATPTDSMVVFPVAWRSWLWQWKHRQGSHHLLQKGIALVVRSARQMSLWEHCCPSAFWNLSRTSIVQLARDRCIDVDSSTNLCNCLFTIVQSSLGMTDDETLDVVSARLRAQEPKREFATPILEIEKGHRALRPGRPQGGRQREGVGEDDAARAS